MPETETVSRALASSWVLFRLGRETYGLPTSRIHEMVILGDLVDVPNQPEYMRGVMNLRGDVIPVVDLRRRLGLPHADGQMAELMQLLDDRRQDHINWLDELKQSVQEGREFHGELDPSRCKFGRWLSDYQTENIQLRMLLYQFEAPHRAIHQIGHTVTDLVSQGRQDEAMARIHAVWDGELKHLMELFETTKEEIRSGDKRIVLVVDIHGHKVGLTVDTVSEVRSINPEQMQPARDILGKGRDKFISGVNKHGGRAELMLAIDQLVEDEFV